MISTLAQAEPIGGIAGFALDLMDKIGAPGAALFVALDSFIVGFPGEVMLPMAGFSASRGSFSLVSAILWTTLGSVVGGLLSYLVGMYLGRDRLRALMHKLPLMKAADFDKTEAWFSKHGRKAVFFGRMLPLFRTIISLPAGVERMPIPLYVALTAAGSLIWNSTFVGAGYALGANWQRVEPYMDTIQYSVLAVLLIVIVGFVAKRLRRRADEKVSN
ncbi:DedA family protein [Streptomyces sp. GMY02]|uniref:DedA family protein n=1 Tax=Streptomyces sp. GMY02 TaxID=1333528 RepID=UPI001C2CA99A|nr:DedA family protein [Streptomyces sp. GMY02]QXE38418.1 DedA family protein [Streptomyces sp. GMY02]